MFKRATRRSLVVLLLTLCVPGTVRAAILIQGNMTQEKTAKPGESYRGTIVLRNTDDTPGEAKVYQTDYSFSADGSNFYGPPGQLPRSNAKWISLSREVVTVPPRGTERIDYEVTVPAGKGARLSGSYWSMVMVEPISKGSQESAGPAPEGTARVKQVLRYGIQVVSQLGKAGPAALTFANPQLLKEDEQRLFAIDVANTGQQLLRPTLWLELYTATGSPIGKFHGSATRLYPGTSARFKIDLAKTPNGKYLGMVAADGAGDNLFGANVELELK
jgi:hypothetical protein